MALRPAPSSKSRARQAFWPVHAFPGKPILLAHYVHRFAQWRFPQSYGFPTNRLYISDLCDFLPLARWMQFPLCLPAWGKTE